MHGQSPVTERQRPAGDPMPRAARIAVLLAAGTLVLLLLSVPAFWPGYLSRPWADADAYTHFHALAGTAWMLLLTAQALLAAARRRFAHRLLGRLSFLLAPAFAVSGVLLAHARFSRMDAATFEAAAYTAYLPLSASCLFAAAWALALRWRRSPALHARLMACTALPLLDPVLGRVLAFHVVELPAFWHYQIATFGLELLLLAMMWRTLPRAVPGRRAFAAFCVFYAVALGTWFLLPGSAAWRDMVDAFRALPLT